MTTSLYVMQDASDDVLYIGIANSALGRFSQHKQAKPWWPEVASIAVTHYATRAEAEAAELQAIADLRPRYNVKGNSQFDPNRRTVGVTELRVRAKELVDSLDQGAVTVLRRNVPIAVLIRPERIEELQARIEDLEDEVATLRAGEDGEPLEWGKVKADLGLH